MPKVVHLNMLKKYTGPSIPPQLTDDFSETGSEDKVAGGDNSDVDNADTNPKEGNTEAEIPEEMPQTLENEQPDGSID